MEINEDICRLAQILRNNGDKILNGFSKLTLSNCLLNSLNECFNSVIEQRDTLTSSFQVIQHSNTKVEVVRDLHFLHDFVQKVLGLKLTAGEENTSCVNITRFKNLKYLELQKVNVATLVGLEMLRSQLQFLVCYRSLKSLKDVLESCGADGSQGFVWGELKEGIFTHNNLQTIDNSLEYTPWLHTLDLSYNNIRDAQPISCLSGLKYLNISYNNIESIPAFTGQICNRLQVLVVKNNFIQDIRNVAFLENLSELDLSNNCILEHGDLTPIAHLEALQRINLKGNPISFHPQHRIRSAQYLHINVNSVRFLLDEMLLSKHEQQFVASLHPVSHHFQRSMVCSINSVASESTIVSSERPRKIRNATIADVYHEPDVQSGTSVEHIKVKNKIEHLIEQHGEKWLKYQAGTSVQDALGFEDKSMLISSTPNGKESVLTNEPREIKNDKEKIEVTSEISVNTYNTAQETVLSDNSLYQQENENSGSSLDEDVDLGDGEESLYLATIKGKSDSVILVVTNTYLSERECSTSKERTRWPIESLISCDTINEDVQYIQLKFDTLRRDHKQRQYELDNEEAERLVSVLKRAIASKPKNKPEKYQCMRCLITFSKEKTLYIHDDEKPPVDCPQCGSTLIIEDDS